MWFWRAYTAQVITEEELADINTYPDNQRIRDAAWLHPVAVDWEEGHRLVRYLRHDRWGSDHNEDFGEAEVIALCRRYGWIAVMEDFEGRRAARECGVTSARTLSIIVAAASCGLMTADEGWKLHVRLERDRQRADLTPDEKHRPVFDKAVELLGKAWEAKGRQPWPWLLSQPVDDAVVAIREKLTGS
jgi:predicted nucleic acid-binding protein